MISFKELGLDANILRAIEDLGFENATEIQEQAIPHLLSTTTDLVALAQTGTGKTAAFGLPILQEIDSSIRDVQAIILCPTRELCMQLAKDMESYSKYQKNIEVLAVYGGTPIVNQIKALRRGVQIVVGTPGRTLDLINRKKLHLGNINFVVFDEADEMLSMGFKEDMDSILEVTPEEKKVLLFSATMPREIARMAKLYMKTPHEISIGHKNAGANNVDHFYYDVPGRKKYEVLKRLVDINTNIYGIVFCRTRAETKDIAEKLGKDGYSADAIHGDLSQAQRDYVMKRFRTRQLQLLVATDVAARGIDVDDLTHVINYNLPDEIATYVHRSGRTGRANKYGISIVLLSGRDRNKLGQLERKIGKKIEKKAVPSGKDVCKAQLFQLMDKVKMVEVTEDIEEYLPVIYEKLEGFSREEIIQKFVFQEFNRFLAYYKDADDLNVRNGKSDRKRRDKDQAFDRRESRRDRGSRRDRDDRGRRRDRDDDRGNRRDRDDDRGSRRDRNDDGGNYGDRKTNGRYDRFFINLGEKHQINPSKLLDLINKQTPDHSVEVGKIEILGGFSFFEVTSDFTPVLLKAFSKAKYDGYDVVVQPSSPRPSVGSTKGKKKNIYKGRDNDRGGNRDGRSRSKRKSY